MIKALESTPLKVETRVQIQLGVRGNAQVRRSMWIRVDSGRPARWLPFRLVPQRHCPRPQLQPAHELQVDMIR